MNSSRFRCHGDMRLSFKKAALVVLLLYLLGTSYTVYLFLYGTQKGQDDDSKPRLPKQNLKFTSKLAKLSPAQLKTKPPLEDVVGVQTVDIWGKAAIGLYLWQHILEGHMKEDMHGAISIGATSIKNIVFRFRTGPWVVPDRIPSNIKNMVLVLNGREPEKVRFAMAWLDRMRDIKQIKNFALVMLGNEQCENDWLKPYLVENGGYIKLVFMVYDSPDVNNVNYFQWPLGVSTYRDFPVLANLEEEEISQPRPFVCNFLGTVYPNSSREVLMNILKDPNIAKKCISKPRMKWLPAESDATRIQYIKALRISDLTLCPIGINTECYRIYEAMMYGSVPVIEDVMSPGRCGGGNAGAVHNLAPLRLLKRYGAPVIFVSNWSELPKLIAKEAMLSQDDKMKRRKAMLDWYDRFKNKIRDNFVNVLNKNFFETNYTFTGK